MVNEYRYTLKNMNESSAKYGPCAICGKHTSEVYHQTEERQTKFYKWTTSGCHNLFGHKDCLIQIRHNTKGESKQ